MNPRETPGQNVGPRSKNQILGFQICQIRPARLPRLPRIPKPARFSGLPKQVALLIIAIVSVIVKNCKKNTMVGTFKTKMTQDEHEK